MHYIFIIEREPIIPASKRQWPKIAFQKLPKHTLYRVFFAPFWSKTSIFLLTQFSSPKRILE